MIISSIFTADDNVIQIGSKMLEMITPCYVFFVFIEILSGALRGIGDVLIPMLLTMFGICALRIVWVAIAVPVSPSVATIIFSYPITWVLTSILFIIYYVYKQKRLFLKGAASKSKTPAAVAKVK